MDVGGSSPYLLEIINESYFLYKYEEEAIIFPFSLRDKEQDFCSISRLISFSTDQLTYINNFEKPSKTYLLMNLILYINMR